ncbi:MAG TPA: uroporphyrinogen-III C-methyltransferase [Noviherbaspirillum sp.]
MPNSSGDQPLAGSLHKPASSPGVAPSTAAVEPSARSNPNLVLYIAIAVFALMLGAQWWFARQQLGDLREDVAQRLRSGETASAEARVMLRSIQDELRQLQGKVNVVESRQSETQSQQLALEQLYHELARTRDDWTLAEIEQVLSTANQQLQLAGNVQGAVIALQNADARLAASDAQQFNRIRRAIAIDLERLKSLPVVDLNGIALRLDSVIGQVSSLPLLAGEAPALPAVEPKVVREETQSSPAAAGADSDWQTRVQNAWHSWSTELWNEVKQVIRVRNVEHPDALLLSPSQAYYARENLKLRLLNARLALLTRNESAFRSDLMAAQDAIARYFDTRAKQTQTVQSLLRQVQSSQLAIDMPTLTESLNAVREHKAAPKSAS